MSPTIRTFSLHHFTFSAKLPLFSLNSFYNNGYGDNPFKFDTSVFVKLSRTLILSISLASIFPDNLYSSIFIPPYPSMAASSSHAAAQDKGKGPIMDPPAPPALHVLNQVNDEVIDDLQLQTNDSRILISFTVGEDVHCFIGPIETLERANKKLHFFPSAQWEDLFINQDLHISFFINQKPFRNNSKINPQGTDFTAWYEHLAPSKSAAWGALGIQNLLRLSHFSPSTLPWMIGAFSPSLWNDWYVSLLDVAAITGLPISSPDFTFDMQPRQQYNISPTTSYSDFIAHHMGAEGTGVIDDEHVAFLFYWLNVIVFCSRSVQMSKLFLSLAALLYEGNNLNLAKQLLGRVFEELGQFTGGPLWPFQLWLNAIFEKYMIKPGGGATDKQHIEAF
ncbi:hypothetical protein Ahy_B01g052785 [Arachis hypogaea]|uniref:Aminotransferase-like plant mobile domain-containing protein n=1 Tax=Arachis hypogaea TaxID=3818 RepID=A0A445AQD5_ARAHY|nr:hypothetical protein Ahy_B01g052785 [Arachis hypogaea]